MTEGLRTLTLIGVTDGFSFDYCSIYPYIQNAVPGRQIRIVEDDPNLQCGCLTAFYRKYGKFCVVLLV